jgi:isochorismate synthase
VEKVVDILERTVKPGEAELFEILLTEASEKDYSFALWRLPNDQTKNLILSFSANPLEPKAIIEDLSSGFIFAPFDKTKSRYFLKADLLFSFSEGALKEPTNSEQTSAQHWLNEVVAKGALKNTKNFFYKESAVKADSDKESYEQLVRKSIDQIEAGTFEKIVPSRSKRVDLPESFDVIETFQKLCDTFQVLEHGSVLPPSYSFRLRTITSLKPLR